MYVGRDFDVCDPVETETYGFDFVNDIPPGDSVVSATWNCTVAEGTDPNPSARLLGTAWLVSSTQTVQVVTGGVAGVRYVLQAIVKTGFGSTVSLYSYSQCEVGS